MVRAIRNTRYLRSELGWFFLLKTLTHFTCFITLLGLSCWNFAYSGTFTTTPLHTKERNCMRLPSSIRAAALAVLLIITTCLPSLANAGAAARTPDWNKVHEREEARGACGSTMTVHLLDPLTWYETAVEIATVQVCDATLEVGDSASNISAVFNHTLTYRGTLYDLYAYPMADGSYWVAIEIDDQQDEFLFDGSTWTPYEPDWGNFRTWRMPGWNTEPIHPRVITLP